MYSVINDKLRINCNQSIWIYKILYYNLSEHAQKNSKITITINKLFILTLHYDENIL